MAFEDDMRWALIVGDRDDLERCLRPSRDGRHATHDASWNGTVATAGGLELLPFWIDQLDANYCKVAEVQAAFVVLFDRMPDAFTRSQRLEPASVCLRRTLLPVAHRLRWSRIANGYVVAGQ